MRRHPLRIVDSLEQRVLLAASDLQVVTTFEDGSWQPWHYSVEGAGSFNIVQASAADPVRAGSRSAKSILPAGSKRSEMYLYPPPARDAEMWYGFSVFIPSDYAADPYNDIIAQWHEVPDWHLGEDWRVPPLTLTIQQNQWRVSSRWDTRPVNVGGWDPPAPHGGRAFFDPGAVARGTWTDWVFHVKWSFGSDGVLEVWQNGNKVADRIGPNTYNDQLGNYMKVGIYHPDAPQDINPVTPVKTAWYDEIRVAGQGATYADVAPGQNGPAPVSTTLRASADATVRDGSYAAQNYGLETELAVKGADAGYRRETYVRFDLTTLAPVTQAKLRLFGRAQTSESIGVALYRALPTPWNETSLTWNSRPLATGAALGAQTVSGTGGRWYEFDVTTHLQQQRAAGATQVTYILRPTTSGAAQALFNSDEHATNKPQLFVRHTAVEPPTPPGVPVTIPALEAAYVRDGASATQNFGAAADLQLKKSGVGSNRETWLKFDLSGASSITSAKLRMFGRIDSATESPTVAVYAADGGVAWAESALTWANRPAAVGTTALATRTVATSTPKWYEWDVTDFLRSEKAAGRNVVTLVLRSLTTTTPHMIFNSDEAATNRPELVVSSSGVVAPPAQSLVVSTGALSVEEGGTARFSVRLATQPSGDVTVSASRASGDADVSVAAGQQLVFTPANWNVAQEVTLAAAHDADTFNGSAVIQLTSPGLDAKSVTATEADDDVPVAPPVTPVVLRANADAFVRGGAYAGANYGADTTLAVKHQPDAGYVREAYLRFDLSSAPAAIGAAKLRLYGKLNETAAGGVGVEVRGVEGGADWGESGLTWDNRPAPTTGVLATTTVAGTTSAWYEFDLSAFLQQQKSAGATAVTLVLRGAAAANAQCVFQSDEAANNRPELVITPAAAV